MIFSFTCRMFWGSSLLLHVSVFHCPVIFYCSFIHSTVDSHLGCLNVSVIMNTVPINSSSYKFCVAMFSFLLGMCLGVELLDHLKTLSLTFWGMVRLSELLHCFTFPSALYEGGIFSTSCPQLVFFVLLIVAILNVKRFISVVLIYISLRATNV